MAEVCAECDEEACGNGSEPLGGGDVRKLPEKAGSAKYAMLVPEIVDWAV